MKWLVGACCLAALVGCKAQGDEQSASVGEASAAASVVAPSAAPMATPAAAPSGAGAHETLGAALGIVDASLYDLELKLTDQHGAEIQLDAFRGHPVIISMFYASCPFACPTLISDIQRFDKSLDEATRARLRVLLVSIDPERDTPENLRALAARHQLDTTRYRLASAPDGAVRELAAALGFKYRKLEGGAFNHSSLITLLDPRGFPATRIEGLNQPSDALVARLKAMP